MGRKGKMSIGRNDGAGKWATQSNLRNLSDSIHEARKSAYDHAAIEYKRMEEMTKQRKRLIFPHLNYLVKERLYDDSHRNLPTSHYDPSWYRQMLYTKNDTDKIIIKTSEVAKRKFITSLLSRYSTNSILALSSLCVHTMAKTACLYESEDLKFALSTVPYDKTELFSLLCCLYNTQSDDNISVLSHDFLQRTYLSSSISDKGVRSLLQDMHHSKRGQYTALESWEMIDPSEISASTFIGLREVYLLSSPISSSTVSLIGEECYNLQKLCLYNVQFSSEQQLVDPIVFCLQFFELLSSGFISLNRLELLQCAWIRREGMLLWARNLAQQRILGNTILPNLQILCLSILYKSHYEIVSPVRVGEDSVEHSWDFLENFLLSHCGIEVEFVS